MIVCLLCLGGNECVGVFVFCVMYCFNFFGLFKVKLEWVECKDGEVLLYLGSVDLVNGMFIFDIKFYIYYVDSEFEVIFGFV